MLRAKRLEKVYRGEWHAGGRIADRQHVASSDLQICRAVWKRLAPNSKRLGRGRLRDARHAAFRGALASHFENQKLMARWRL